jgi:hypothetical protein
MQRPALDPTASLLAHAQPRADLLVALSDVAALDALASSRASGPDIAHTTGS